MAPYRSGTASVGIDIVVEVVSSAAEQMACHQEQIQLRQPGAFEVPEINRSNTPLIRRYAPRHAVDHYRDLSDLYSSLRGVVVQLAWSYGHLRLGPIRREAGWYACYGLHVGRYRPWAARRPRCARWIPQMGVR